MSSNPRSAFLPTGFTASPPSIDPEVWATCAGPLLRIPPLGSLAVYCPQGHAEQRLESIDAARDLASRTPHPPQLLCQVLSVALQADEKTEELSVRYKLRTASPATAEAQRLWEAASPDLSGEDAWIPPARMGSEHAVWKVLSRSDIYGQGGLAVPKRAAEMCLPPLDVEMDQPSQNVAATDLFGNQWAFRHVIRGKPLRNLLTTNWNRFVAQKKLQAPDRVVLIRGENGRLKIGVRRSKSIESPTGRAGGGQRPRPIAPRTLALAESIFHDAHHASLQEGSVFQVTYTLQPHSNATFVVPLDAFCKGLKQQRLLTPGRSLKMAFETMEFGVRRFRGQILENEASSHVPSELQVHDLPTQWRCIQVEWADNDPLMPKPSRVSPWDVAPASADQNAPLSPVGGLGGACFRSLDHTPELPVPAPFPGPGPLQLPQPPRQGQQQGQLGTQAQAQAELLGGPPGQVLGFLRVEQLLAGQAVAAGVLGALRTAQAAGQLQTQSQEQQPEQGLQTSGSASPLSDPSQRQPAPPTAPLRGAEAAPRGGDGAWAEAHTPSEPGATHSGPWDVFSPGERRGGRQKGDAQAMDVQMQGSQGLWPPQGQGQGVGQGGGQEGGQGQGGGQGGGPPAELLSRSQRRDLWLSMQHQEQQQGQGPPQAQAQAQGQARHVPPLSQRPGPQPLQQSGSYSPGAPHPMGLATAGFSLGSLSSPEFHSVLHPPGKLPQSAGLPFRGQHQHHQQQQQMHTQRGPGAGSLLGGGGQQGAGQHGHHPGSSQTEQQAALDTFNTAVLALELNPGHFLISQEGHRQEEPEGQGERGGGGGGMPQTGPQRPQSFQERATPRRGASPALLAAEAGSEALLRSFSHGAVVASHQKAQGAGGGLPPGIAGESELPKGGSLFPHPSVKREPSDSFLPRSPRSATNTTAGSTPNPSPLGTAAPSYFWDFRLQGSQGSPATDSEHSLRDSPTRGSDAMGFPAGTSRFKDAGSSLQSPLGGSGSGSGSGGGGSGGARGEGGFGAGGHSVVVKRQRMEWASAAEGEAGAGGGGGASESRRALWDIPQLSAAASMPERAQWPETPTDSPTQGHGHVVTDSSGRFRDAATGGALQGLGTRFAPGVGERVLGSGTGSLRERAMGTGPGEPQQGELTAARQQQGLSGRLPPVWAPRRAHGSPSPLGTQEGEEHDLSLRLGSGFAGPGETEGAPAEEEKGQGQDHMQEGEPSAAPPAVTRWLMD